MEPINNIGFASIKVTMKDGKFASEPTFAHKFPEGMTRETVDVAHLERDLRAGLDELLEEGKLPDNGNVGFFTEYTPEACKKAP